MYFHNKQNVYVTDDILGREHFQRQNTNKKHRGLSIDNMIF